jgi:FAD/FMN-containing dehydrogenase
MLLNDVHSRLNPTEVARVEEPADGHEVAQAVLRAQRDGLRIIACGRRHAMGGQQFCPDGVVVDTSRLTSIDSLDRQARTVRVGAGVIWPDLLRWLDEEQADDDGPPLTFRQKQTGADDLTTGGAVSANAHGRGLEFPPIVDDVEELTLVDASGEVRHVSRESDEELFSLVVGGYGLFGVIVDVTLRLVPRTRLVRVVEEVPVEQVIERLESQRDAGCAYGDWQFDIDSEGGTLLRRGIMSCYRTLGPGELDGHSQGAIALSREGWAALVQLTEQSKALAYETYRSHYMQTEGQVYWSDSHQLATYLHDYADLLAEVRGLQHDISLMIGELYVPREAFTAFATEAVEVLRETGAEVLYGTVRLIERDDESMLAWARERWACTIFNIVVEDVPGGLERAQAAFGGLVDAALAHGGSFFLTYHLWVDASQLRAAHPRIDEFVTARRERGVSNVFASAWSDRLDRLLT